ncbi:MAG: alpha/beta hydrolase [Rhabdochlamydiaceae bacterium]
MTSKEYDALLQQLKKRPSSAHLSVQEIRAGFEKLLATFPPEPDVEFESFFIDSIPACWALAPGASRRKVILFFHGGGFNAGSIEGHRDLMGRISRTSGCTVLAIAYRLAPEYPFPAALEDALKGYQWLLDHSYSPSNIVFAGISAGGGLALSLCLKLKDQHLSEPAAVICICPTVDLTFSSDSIKRNEEKDWIRIDRIDFAARNYYRGQDPTNPLISPLYGNLSGLPPLLIQVGSSEMLRDEAVAIAEKAKESGVSVSLEEWPEMIHCWHFFASKIPEGREAIDHIGKFLRKTLKT